MKNKSFKVIEYGFPKLGTVLDLGFCYNAYVIGYEKQMSIVDLLIYKKGKLFLEKAEYESLINGIISNKFKFMDKSDDFKLVNRVYASLAFVNGLIKMIYRQRKIKMKNKEINFSYGRI